MYKRSYVFVRTSVGVASITEKSWSDKVFTGDEINARLEEIDVELRSCYPNPGTDRTRPLACGDWVDYPVFTQDGKEAFLVRYYFDANGFTRSPAGKISYPVPIIRHIADLVEIV